MSSIETKICLLGYSGHGYVIGEALLLLGYKEIWYADQQENKKNPLDFKYAGFERDPDFPWAAFDAFALGVGENNLRLKIARYVSERSARLPAIVHPDSHISAYSTVEQGTFVARGACINPFVQVGRYVIVNTSASIDHECIIGTGAHIGPGAVLAGNVSIGVSAFIGANAVIRQGLNIGEKAVIGAGAVVVKDVEAYQQVVGNPARSKTHSNSK